MEGSIIKMKFDFREKLTEISKYSLEDKEEELIQIDDDDQSENANDKFCEYPVGSPNTVIVNLRDYLSLEHGTFLNDSIIDFYLNYLYDQILPSDYQDQVHIFSSFFYKRLLLEKPHSEKDVALSPANKRHARVSSWTKNIDIFSKSVLIIPICEDSHWYFLMVVGLPGGLSSSPVLCDPFILVLDSLGGYRKKTARIIRQYLASEFEAKQMEGECGFTDSDIPSIRPVKPEQPNGTDCGIYLLHYVEKIFSDMSQFMTPDLPNLEEWFFHEDVVSKRSEIAELVRDLSREQNQGKPVQFPDIPFTEEEAYLVSLENSDEPGEEIDESIEISDEEFIEDTDVNDDTILASVIERNPSTTVTKIMVPATDLSIFKDFIHFDRQEEYKYDNQYKNKDNVNISNNNIIKNIKNNNNNSKCEDANMEAKLTPKRGIKRPNAVLEEEIESDSSTPSCKRSKKDTPSRGSRGKNPYNLPPPDESTCKMSSDMKDCCKTLCKICNQPYPLTAMRSHTLNKHKLQISKYKEIHGPFQIIEVVYHKCKLCGKLVLLDGDALGGHIKGVHKMKEAEYNNQYIKLSKTVQNKRNKNGDEEVNFFKKLSLNELLGVKPKDNSEENDDEGYHSYIRKFDEEYSNISDFVTSFN